MVMGYMDVISLPALECRHNNMSIRQPALESIDFGALSYLAGEESKLLLSW